MLVALTKAAAVFCRSEDEHAVAGGVTTVLISFNAPLPLLELAMAGATLGRLEDDNAAAACFLTGAGPSFVPSCRLRTSSASSCLAPLLPPSAYVPRPRTQHVAMPQSQYPRRR